MTSYHAQDPGARSGPPPRSRTERKNLRYHLEIVQSPVRARTCGFGTKDRRPLAPAAVAKLTVRRPEDGSIVHPEDVNIAFLVAMVELWTSDATENRTMVTDPSAKQQNVSLLASELSGAVGRPSGSADINAAATPSQNVQQRSGVMEAYPPFSATHHAQSEPWSHQYWEHSHPQHSVDVRRLSRQEQPSASSASHFLSRVRKSSLITEFPGSTHSRALGPGDPFSTHSSSPVMGVSAATGSVSPHYRSPVSLSPSPRLPSSQSPRAVDATGFSLNDCDSPQVNNLLGPIHANAARLLDEQDRMGIFFVFQDLSIRTEGEFRLKVKLLTVAPIGAREITHQETPVLAEAWSNEFTVYPPKKFPGVPGTTPLSATFGRQGQRFPSRNRPAREDLELGHNYDGGYSGGPDQDELDDEP